MKNITNFRPESRLHPILGEGLAECAGPAEALELVKNLTVHLARLDPRNGGGGFNRLRAFRRARVLRKLFEVLPGCGSGLWKIR